MPRTRLALCLSFLSLAACSSPPEKKPTILMADWTTPTDQHKEIVTGAGEWEGTLTMFGANATPQPIPVKESVEAVGPFWIQSKFTCDFMGMPYHGTGCVGYDLATKKYIGTWVDSMSSYFAWMEGTKDASGKLVLYWMAPDETTGEPVQHRSESMETVDGRVTTFFQGEGAGTKTMVIETKRKK